MRIVGEVEEWRTEEWRGSAICMEDYSGFISRAAVSGSASQSVLEATSRAYWALKTHTHCIARSLCTVLYFEVKNEKQKRTIEESDQER